LSDADAREVCAALDARHSVIVTVEYRGFTPAGEVRIPSSEDGSEADCSVARG
jgi:hypothetical protein